MHEVRHSFSDDSVNIIMEFETLSDCNGYNKIYWGWTVCSIFMGMNVLPMQFLSSDLSVGQSTRPSHRLLRLIQLP